MVRACYPTCCYHTQLGHDANDTIKEEQIKGFNAIREVIFLCTNSKVIEVLRTTGQRYVPSSWLEIMRPQ